MSTFPDPRKPLDELDARIDAMKTAMAGAQPPGRIRARLMGEQKAVAMSVDSWIALRTYLQVTGSQCPGFSTAYWEDKIWETLNR